MSVLGSAFPCKSFKGFIKVAKIIETAFITDFGDALGIF